jgi:hypothetical protein
MGKHQCLELLLQHHTLFAEEEIVKPSRFLSRTLHRYLALPVIRLAAKSQRRSLFPSSFRGENQTTKIHLSVASDPSLAAAAQGGGGSSTRSNSNSEHHDQLASRTPPAPLARPPPSTLGIQQQPPPLSAPGTLQGRRHRLHALLPDHHHHGHGDSLALDAHAEMALRLAMDPQHQQHQHDGGHHHHHHALDDEMSTLVNLALCSWSRDCLDLLVTYGSAVFADEEEDGMGVDDEQAAARAPRWGFLWHTTPHDRDHDAGHTRRRSRLKASLRGRLYGRVAATPFETRLRLTAAAALHHPRDLQWMMDPAGGNVLGGRKLAGGSSSGSGGGGEVDVAGFLRRVFRKIKHDAKSTKDMKVVALRRLCEGVVAAGLLPTATSSSGGGGEPVLTVDFSSMGMDDAYLEHVLQSLWDVTATGVPTRVLLDNNALTDVGVRALVLQYRANMAASASRPKGRGPHSPLGYSSVSVSGAGGGDAVRPTSPLSAAGSGHAGGGGGVTVMTSYIGQSHQRQPRAPPSLVALSLNGNQIGTDGAQFLADLIADSHAALAAVTVYKTECSVASPTSLAFDRVVDRSLSLEAALVVAILVDAYVGLRRFVFTLREAEGPVPLAMARLNLLNELDLRGNALDGALLPSLLLVHRKHLGGNRLGLPWDGLQELEHAMAIDCRESGLAGPIPPTWGSPHVFPMLKALDLSDNPALEGPVPAGEPKRVAG